MQSGQGYCNYCHEPYNNLEEHINSAQHRNATTQNRRRIETSSLMERFLQDVLCHHPYHYIQSRSTQNERHSKNTVSSNVADFPPSIPMETVRDNSGVRGDIHSRGTEAFEELQVRPRRAQKYSQDVSIRPSVIQKLEKGHQYPLEFAYKIKSGMEEFKAVGVSQNTNNGQNSGCSTVIFSAPTALSGNSYDRPVTSNTARLPRVAHLDQLNKSDPNKSDSHPEKPGQSSSNPVIPSHLEMPSVSYTNPKELNRKSCINSGKLILQKDVKFLGKTLPTGFKLHEFTRTMGSFRLEPLPKSAVSSAASPNKIIIPSSKGSSEDAFLKTRKELFSKIDQIQEEKHFSFSQLEFSEPENSAYSDQSVSSQSQDVVQQLNLSKEKQLDPEGKNYESRHPEMSSDCNSSCPSLTDQSKATLKEINLPVQVNADQQNKSNEACVSEINYDSDGSFHLVTNKPQVIHTEISLQKTMHIRLVDKSYDSSSSEMNFDCDTSHQSVTDYPQQSGKEVNLPKEVHIGSGDRNNGSNGSETSADSAYALQTVIVKERKVLMKSPMGTTDKDYESSGSEASFDCKIALQSVPDHLQQAAMEGNPEDRHADLEDENCKPSTSKGCLSRDVSLQAVTDQPKRAVGERSHLKEKNADLVDKNSDCHGPKRNFHGGTQKMTDQSYVTIKEVNPLGFPVELQNQNDEHSISDPSVDSHDSFGQLANDEPQEAGRKTSLTGQNDDTEVKSYDCSSSELTFDSDPILSLKEQSQLDFEEIKDHINQQNKICESNSSEITFDSDISLQSIADLPEETLDEEQCPDLEKKSNESCVSEITFDSYVPPQSDAEQSEEAGQEMTVQEEKHVYLERKEDEFTGSDMSLDSDLSFHSLINPADVVKNVCHQKEEQIYLEKEGNELSGLELSLECDKSATDYFKASMNERDFQKEGQAHTEIKDNSSTSSDISLKSDDPLHAAIAHSDIVNKAINTLKEEHVHLENKDHGSSVSEISLKSGIFRHVVTDHSDIANKKASYQKEEHVHLVNKKEVDVSETRLPSDIPVQSVIHDLKVEEIYLQNEKYVYGEGRRAEPGRPERSLDSEVPHCSVIEIQTRVERRNIQRKEPIILENKGEACTSSKIVLNSEAPCHLVTEPQISVEKRNIQNEEPIALENKREACSNSEILLYSDVNYLATESHISARKRNIQKEKHAALKNKSGEGRSSEAALGSEVSFLSQTQKLPEGSSGPENGSTAPRGFEMNLDIETLLHSITSQHQLPLLKERYVDLEDKNSDSKPTCSSDDPIQSLAEQIHEAVKRINLWKEEDTGLENKTDEMSGSMLTHEPNVSLRAEADQPEVDVREINLEKEDSAYQEDKNSQYSGSEMSLDSDLLVESIIDQPQITILEQEHIELEDKHSQSCGSEMSFDSDEPLQSVSDELQKAIIKRNLWEGEDTAMEEKTNESTSYDSMYNSDVYQSVAGPTEEVVKDSNLFKEHVDLDEKIVKPSGSVPNCDEKTFHSVADEIQGTIREINVRREKNICLDEKSYELNRSKIVYASSVPKQSVAGQSEILEAEHTNLEDRRSDPCHPKGSFDSDPLQSMGNQLQKSVKEVSLWKEDHIYLEDKRYKLGDFEVTLDSEAPVQFAAGQSPETVREKNFPKKNHDDLKHKDCKSSASAIKCDYDHFQIDIDQVQVVCREKNLHKEKHLGMEETTVEPSDSEIVCDSDVPLQIVVNQPQMSVKKRNVHKMVFLDLVTSDSDCEIIPAPDLRIQSVIVPPRGTGKKVNCKNADGIALGGDSWGSEIRYVCEDPPQLVAASQSKETLRLVNQKGDYIVLEDLTYDSCGSETDFNVNVTQQSMTYQSHGAGKKMEKYRSENKHCESSGAERNFNWQDSSQTMADQEHNAPKKNSLPMSLKDSTLKEKSCEFSEVEYDTSAEFVIHEMTPKENPWKLKHTDLVYKACEQCRAAMNLQGDLSLQCDSDQLRAAANNTELFKKISIDLKDDYDSHSSAVFTVDPQRDQEKAKVIDENSAEPVLEALPHVPASFVGKTWSQIMKEDDAKINTLVKEFREGHFHSYFDDNCEARRVQKKVKKRVTWADLDQEMALVQVLPDSDDTASEVSDTDNSSMTFDKSCLHSPAKGPYNQTSQVVSQGQTVRDNYGMKTNFSSYSERKRKIMGQEEDSPKGKCLRLQDDQTTKNQNTGITEFSEPNAEVLKPLQPNAFIYVLSSPNAKQKEGESFNFSKARTKGDTDSWDDTQYKYEQSSFKYYDPLTRQIVINPPDTVVPECDSHDWDESNFDRNKLDFSAQDDDASESFMIVPVRYGLMAHQGASGSVFLEKSETLSSSEVPKESNFHLMCVNPEAAQISGKPMKKGIRESKSKNSKGGKVKMNKQSLPPKEYMPNTIQQKTKMPSEKQSIRTKSNDILRKYISKYSDFLHHRYQSKSTFVGMHLKKENSDVNRLMKVTGSAKEMGPTPSAGTNEQMGEPASSAPRRSRQESSRAARRKKDGRKKCLSTPKQPSISVKMYALRSLSSQMPQSERQTRLSRKLRGKEVN
ncbi:PREDICTED: DBF4-type zinc finger-containing protein 2-like [Elephantulus edwardii]|uniref:DBF4-type zinc finger-containing protein 2-like n=1 Tax=Elephantulus edwardii TaxID=28737 RepID=UPI0003F07832|nr:PREDICTED: DBF4-type zinc finger-containing protein 2-like [Elephantulus edwardii]